MDLFLHDGDLRLADFRVELGLHLCLELDLPLPEEDLSFSLHDLSKNLCLLISERLDLVLEVDTLVLQLFKLLDEL